MPYGKGKFGVTFLNGIAGAAAMLGMSASDVEAQMGQRDNMSGLLGMPTESALRDYLNQ